MRLHEVEKKCSTRKQRQENARCPDMFWSFMPCTYLGELSCASHTSFNRGSTLWFGSRWSYSFLRRFKLTPLSTWRCLLVLVHTSVEIITRDDPALLMIWWSFKMARNPPNFGLLGGLHHPDAAPHAWSVTGVSDHLSTGDGHPCKGKALDLLSSFSMFFYRKVKY